MCGPDHKRHRNNHRKHPSKSRPFPACSQDNIGEPKNFILIIGYCVKRTLGAQIVAVHCRANILCESRDVRARIPSVEARSSHADKPELRRHVESLGGEFKKVSVIHGKESQCLAFAETVCGLRSQAEIVVPEYKKTVSI